MRESRNRSKYSKIKNIILRHINNNLKDYTILTLFFIVGIIVGVIFINNINESEQNQISGYVKGIINSLNQDYEIDNLELFKKSLLDNFKLTCILWLMGLTVIGMPLIYGVISYKGFCIGYTSASIIGVLGTKNGIIFLISSLFMQNIIFIPCVLAIGVSGLKLYRSIIKDRRKENIKIEIYRHTVFCTIIFIGLSISSVVEAYVSSSLFSYIVKFLLP